MNTVEVLKPEGNFFSGNAFNIRSLSKVYGIKKVEMSRLLDCKQQQVNAIFTKTVYSPRSESIRNKLLDMIKIYSILKILLKTPDSDERKKELEEKNFQWFRIPNPVFPDAKSPFELVSEGSGNIVIRSLMDELHGATS